MNEDALRALIRQAVERQLTAGASDAQTPLHDEPVAFVTHASHFRYALPGSGEACLIEPAVTCNHCGYCQSHGH
jgi:predicted Zn-ribbon and HTH transcriptional regulator